MDYISRGFKSVLGSGGAPENQPSGAETVERLCDRVSSSTLLEDRRDAVRALKSMSRKFKLEVGSMALEILINVLQTDRNDTEITGLALDTLCNIMSTEQAVQEDPAKNGQQVSDSELGVQFTDIFIKNSDNVTLLLSLLEEYDFHVRWPAVKLLTILLTNKRQGARKPDNGHTGRQTDSYPLQQCILVSPMGVSRLMDLLSDSREIIRNEGLLLLIQLTKSNAAIQKIVAFENAFDRLLEIVSEEGLSEGGIVVEDCLMLMLNLLKSNVSNQNFFREGSYIQRLIPFFEIQLDGEGEDKGWSTQKVSNVNLMLQIVRTLVSPDNPQQSKTSCQRVTHQSGLLKLLCNIIMASGIPAEILTETINTVSEMIRGDPVNQDYFSKVIAPSSPPRSAVVVLLLTMINEKQSLRLRLATLYCFQSYLYKNEAGQNLIVSTLLPSTADDVSTISAGQLLCAGLFSADSLANWCAAIALCHCLKDNMSQKEQLLRVQLATSVGNPPVSLLQQCTDVLSQVSVIQTRVGLLQFLCSWLYDCPIAVSHFLHSPANIPHLISQVQGHGEEEEKLVEGLSALLLGVTLTFNDDSVENNSRKSLQEIINKRIGGESLLDKMGYVSKSEYFTLAAKSPQIQISTTLDHVLFDFEFTKLFKKLDASITKAVETPDSEPQVNGVDAKKSQGAEHESIVASYKELIREQDSNLSKLKSRCQEIESLYQQSQAQLQHHMHESQQLREQLHVLQSFQAPGNAAAAVDTNADMVILQTQVRDLVQLRDSFQVEFAKKDERIKTLEKEVEIAQASLAAASASATLNDGDTDGSLASELEQLKISYRTQQEEINSLKSQNSTLNQELQLLRTQTSVSSATSETAAERDRLLATLADQQSTIKQLEQNVAQLTSEKQELKESSESTHKEHEDLLVLLTDQDEKLKAYKNRLKELGEEIEDDDDDDFDDDDDDDDDDDEEEDEEEEKGDEDAKVEETEAQEKEDEGEDEDEDTAKDEDDATDEEEEETGEEEAVEASQEKGEIDQDQTEKSEDIDIAVNHNHTVEEEGS